MSKQLQTVGDTDARTETTPVLRPKVEAFAQAFVRLGNAAQAYREAFDADRSSRATVTQRAYELVHRPDVAERVRQLYALAAESTTIDARSRMVRLQEICEADATEIFRVVTEPCAECWSDETVTATAIMRAIEAGAALDTDAPRSDCKACRSHGVQRVIVTPTDQLSPAARRLLKGVRQKASGEIEVRTHCALAASDQLNRMAGVYVDRSVSVTTHVNAPPFAEMTREQQLAFLDTIAPTTRPPPITVDAVPVDAETDHD